MTATAARPSAVPTRRPANCFDALRLAAALAVAVEHATIHLDGRFLWFTPANGWWFPDGVPVFFILSGAMVYASAMKCAEQGRPVTDYLVNRFIRVAPAIYAYAAVMTAVLLAVGALSAGQLASPGFAAWAASHLSLAPVYHPALFTGFGVGVVNGSLWTIPAEVSFYLAVPLLVWLARRSGFKAMAATAFALGVVSLAVVSFLGGQGTDMLGAKLLLVTFLPWLGYFVVGIVAARVWDRIPHHWTLVAAAVGAYAATWVLRRSVEPELSQALGLVSAIPLAYLAFMVGHRGPAFLHRLTGRIGDLSFGVYIWHMPVVNLLLWWAIAPGSLSGQLAVIVATTMSLLLAALSWHLVERRALKLKRYTSRGQEGQR